MRTFREAMDALGLTAEEAAAVFGRPAQSVRQWRLDPGDPSARRPPADWRQRLAAFARTRGGELQELAAELEASE